jgi:glucans biosynthesis protein
MKQRTRLFVTFAWLVLSAALSAADEMFDFETLRYQAKMLAAKPYAPPVNRIPDWLPRLTYDEHRFIVFDPNRSWWRHDGLPFQLQFFHPGAVQQRTVRIYEVRGKRAEPIAFDPQFFIYDRAKLKVGELPTNMGFAGLRVLYPLNHADDELGAFLGASYFRMLCQKAVYGLSARGLAINSGEPGGEEFPSFTDFWIERPAPGAKSLTVCALLDSESVAGAYRFAITPGADTVVQVKTVLYLRKEVKSFGVAPLTSMFWRGENSEVAIDDFRPEVHDSDGLMLFTGAGEWLWRPLTNPRNVRIATFADENPRAFGLVQRDRSFESYQDLEAAYQLRPSTWVEPVGNWGRGSVRLVELPTPTEFNDNIVAFWTPETLPPVGEPIELEYRLHWFLDQIHPPAGYAVGTRHVHSKTPDLGFERFIVDFDGPYLGRHGDDPLIEPVVSASGGAILAHVAVQKNKFNGTWRVVFLLQPDGSGRPVELRCFLRKSPHVLSETWTYLWQP